MSLYFHQLIVFERLLICFIFLSHWLTPFNQEEKSSRLHAVSKAKKNNTLVSGNAGDEKNLHPDGRNFFQIFLPEISLFFICFFCFFWFLFFVVIVSCFLNLKMYILIPNCFNWLFYTVSYFLCKFVTNLFDIKID